MTVQTLTPAPTEAAIALARALESAGLDPSGLVRIAGRGSLAAMLWLCRQGYERAVLVQGPCAPCGEPADALLIPHVHDAEELAHILSASGRVRAGGALVARTGAGCGQAQALAEVIESAGYAVEAAWPGKGHTLIFARLAPATPVRQAA